MEGEEQEQEAGVVVTATKEARRETREVDQVKVNFLGSTRPFLSNGRGARVRVGRFCQY